MAGAQALRVASGPRTAFAQGARGGALALGIAAALAFGSAQAQEAASAAQPDPHVTLLDRIEVTATPLPGSAVDADDLPYTVQSADADDIAQAQAGNLTDFLLRRFNGVGGNDKV